LFDSSLRSVCALPQVYGDLFRNEISEHFFFHPRSGKPQPYQSNLRHLPQLLANNIISSTTQLSTLIQTKEIVLSLRLWYTGNLKDVQHIFNMLQLPGHVQILMTVCAA